MLLSEFYAGINALLEGKECKHNMHNLSVYEKYNAVYMGNDNLSKQDIYKLAMPDVETFQPQQDYENPVSISVKKRLSVYDVRNLCVNRDWFDCGDNEQFQSMLQLCKDSDCSAQSLYRIAKTIFSCTFDMETRYGTSRNDCIAGIMYDLEKLVQTSFEIN